MAIDTGKFVKAYINLRNARAELKQKYDEEDALLKLKQQKIENMLLAHMNETGQTSGKTPFGSFYKQEDVKAMGSDWDALYRWIKENDAFEALERRITRTFVTKYMEENNGAIPPGVSVHREYVVRVRKS
jgi:hypothetical protein